MDAPYSGVVLEATVTDCAGLADLIMGRHVGGGGGGAKKAKKEDRKRRDALLARVSKALEQNKYAVVDNFLSRVGFRVQGVGCRVWLRVLAGVQL